MEEGVEAVVGQVRASRLQSLDFALESIALCKGSPQKLLLDTAFDGRWHCDVPIGEAVGSQQGLRF